MLEARTERLVSEQPAVSFTQHTDRFVIDDDDDMDSNTTSESDLSFKVTIILAQNKMTDCERFGDQSSKDAMQDSNEHSFFKWKNDYVFNIGSNCIQEKELLRKFTLHQKLQ